MLYACGEFDFVGANILPFLCGELKVFEIPPLPIEDIMFAIALIYNRL